MEGVRPEVWEQILTRMEREGVSFYLSGRRARARDVVKKCCVCERAVYMPDFVTDESGKLLEVRYDEVKKW